VFRAEIQQWVSELWAQKDARLVEMAGADNCAVAQTGEASNE